MSDDGNQLARLETTLDHFGEKVDGLHEKVDTIVSALGDFKVEVTRGFGQTERMIDRVDGRLEAHARDDDRRFMTHGDAIVAAKAAVDFSGSGSSATRRQQVTVVGGASVLAGLLTAFLSWLTQWFNGTVPQ